MPKASVHPKNYVIVNIWTSDNNKALPGVNVGHISLTTSKGHISLWPGDAGSNIRAYKKKPTRITPDTQFFSNPPEYLEDYEQDCMRETQSDSGDYELCLMGYELCWASDKRKVANNRLYIDVIPRYSLSLVSSRKKINEDKLYLSLDEFGSLNYNAIISSHDEISGSISGDMLKSISPELGELEAPLTEKQLKIIEKFYAELVNVMPLVHQELISHCVIQYMVKAPSGEFVKDVIKDDIILDDGRDLLNVLVEGVSIVEMQEFLPSLLNITSKRGHTYTNLEDLPIETRKVYLSLTDDGNLRYTVKLSSKEVVTAVIDKCELAKIHSSLAGLTAPLTRIHLGVLQHFKLDLLTITARNGHTKEVLFRPAYQGIVLHPDESIYLFNNIDGTYKAVNQVPRYYPAGYDFVAVKLRHANFRVVLYSLNDNAITQYFNGLQNLGRVAGWSMQGSNLFTRNLVTETTESCASIAFRCLAAGGFYEALKSTVFSQSSSLATPDDLLRHAVAFKEKELLAFSVTRSWVTCGVDISALNDIKNAYIVAGKNANIEDDVIPSVMPSLPRCSIM